ncbi:MAG: hypothetical protein K6G61_07330 [Solobacterium sp.]|nr:hypothetical protein [Solobacterium sp.]
MPFARYYIKGQPAPELNAGPCLEAAVIVTCGSKILLEHRIDTFQWGVLSGVLEQTESFRNCAVRTLTDAGLRMKGAQLKEIGLFDDPHRIASMLDGSVFRIITDAFSITFESEEKTLPGSSGLHHRWVDIKDLSQYRIIPIHKEIIDRLLNTQNTK